MSDHTNKWKERFPGEPEKVHQAVLHTLEALEERPGRKHFSYKKILLFAATLTAVLGITAGAAALFSWDERAIEYFGNPSAELQDKMTAGGGALEQDGSYTAEGITVTALQTIQDGRRIYILLKVTSGEHKLSGGCFNSMRLLTEDGENILNRASRTGCRQTDGSSDREQYLELDVSWDEEWDQSFEKLTVRLDKYKPNGMAGVPSESDIAGRWEIPVTVSNAETMTRVCEPGQELAMYETPLVAKKVVLTPLSVEILFGRVEDGEKIERAARESYIPGNEPGVLRLYGTEDAEGNVTETKKRYSGSLSRPVEGDWKYDAQFHYIVDVEHVKAILLGDHGEIRIELQ